jgi:hypothetical protein
VLPLAVQATEEGVQGINLESCLEEAGGLCRRISAGIADERLLGLTSQRHTTFWSSRHLEVIATVAVSLSPSCPRDAFLAAASS